MSKDTSGPAFPTIYEVDRNGNVREGRPGMTLRQWYAGMAMQGLLASDHEMSLMEDEIARMAWEQADAMLAHESGESDDA